MTPPWTWIAVAVALCAPWPIVAVSWKHRPNPDLVAVPSNGTSLQSRVSTVFGRAKFFQLVDLSTGKVEVISNPYRREKHAVGLRAAHLLAGEDVGVAIGRKVGPEPYNNLAARGVLVFTGRPTTVMDAIVQLRQGQLTQATAPNVATHYGLERQGIEPPAPSCPLAAPPAPPSPVRR